MANSYHIAKLENIIRRIFNSITSSNIEVKYIGKKDFADEDIDQRCFKFQKNNSDFLFFELLILSNDNKAHTIALEEFMNQIMYKYNVENIACFIHDGKEMDIDHLHNFVKEFIFEVRCSSDDGTHQVYVNIDPEEFFN